MDIFIGSNKPLEERLVQKASNIISDLDKHFVKSDQGRILIWKNALYNGEVKVFQDAKYHIVFDGYLNNINVSLEDHLPVLAKRIIEKNMVLENDETGIFNIAVIDLRTNNVYLAGDPSALFPMYYLHQEELFFFSSHMYIFAESYDLKPDMVGIIEKLKFSFTFGSRTIYQALSRINPGEIIVFDQDKNAVEARQSEVYYTQYEEYGKELHDVTWDAINQPIKSLSQKEEKLGIMLSEGFDSRLMAGIASQNGFSISSFTHGTPGTVGANITFAVANQIAAEYHFDPLSVGLPADALCLKSQLYLSDNLSIPYWINGSNHFSTSNAVYVTTGYALDSTLGGHSFNRPNKPRFLAVAQRYREIINQNLWNLRDSYVEELSSELLDNARRNCNSEGLLTNSEYFFAHDVYKLVSENLDLVISDFDMEFKRLANTGSDIPSVRLQRFFLEQRARKFSFGQELTLRIKNRVIVPSYETLSMRVLSKIHPRHRMQHKLYLELLNQHLPYLSTIPNGGYGMAANKPRVVLETSRFIHKYYETEIIRQYLSRKGDQDISKLRTANFIESTYRKGVALDWYRSYFLENETLFNTKKLVEKIDNIKNYSSKSYQLLDFYHLFEIQFPLSKL